MAPQLLQKFLHLISFPSLEWFSSLRLRSTFLRLLAVAFRSMTRDTIYPSICRFVLAFFLDRQVRRRSTEAFRFHNLLSRLIFLARRTLITSLGRYTAYRLWRVGRVDRLKK